MKVTFNSPAPRTYPISNLVFGEYFMFADQEPTDPKTALFQMLTQKSAFNHHTEEAVDVTEYIEAGELVYRVIVDEFVIRLHK